MTIDANRQKQLDHRDIAVQMLGHARRGERAATGQRHWQQQLIGKVLGRRLFGISRQAKAQANDADRLRKYLGRFGLEWSQIVALK